MPKRGTPTTYPAPPLEWTESGLMWLRPAMPVPWRREIFSSSVISFRTRSARSSGETAGFIHGCEGFRLDWAETGRTAADRTESRGLIRRMRDIDIMVIDV